MSDHVPLELTAALIAGGKSSRMGRDKRLIEVDGKPLWQRQIEVLQSLNPVELLISGPTDGPWNGSLPLPDATLSHRMGEGLGVRARGSGEGRGKGVNPRVVADQFSDSGPLSGITAVLTATRSPLVLALAVDMPHMSAAFLRLFLNKCTAERGIVPVRGDLFEPLAAVYPRGCVALAEAQLRTGDFSLQHFVRSCLDARFLVGFKVGSKEEALFHNLNVPDDLPSDARV